MKSRIFYTKPSISSREVEYATDAAKNGWGSRCYEYIERFENAFKQHIGSKYAIATSSCTGALHMGLAALGIDRGDEVILADTNWIATASPIAHLGAMPVFVDILPDTWCIDPKRVEEAITPKTKAIIVTHLYGNLCDMNQLMQIGAQHGIPIVEDAAEGIGSLIGDRCAGTMGRFGTFSFHGSKTISTGEGGMLVTNDQKLYERIRALANHGRVEGQKKQFWPEHIGFKYKIANVQASIGCAQLERVDELVRRKREIFRYYSEKLKSFSAVALNPEHPGTVNGYWMPTAVFEPSTGVTRDHLLEAFAKENIDGRVFFYPLSSLPMFQKKENRYSYELCKRAINLPTYHDMQTEDQDRVVGAVLGVLKSTK